MSTPVKLAQTPSAAPAAGGTDMLDGLKSLWGNLSPEHKQIIVRSLIGGGAGAAGLGALSLFSGRDEDDPRAGGGVMSKAFLGLLLGGLAGGASTMLPKLDFGSGANNPFSDSGPGRDTNTVNQRGFMEGAALPAAAGLAGGSGFRRAFKGWRGYTGAAHNKLEQLNAVAGSSKRRMRNAASAITDYQDKMRVGTDPALNNTFKRIFQGSDTIARLNDHAGINSMRSGRAGKFLNKAVPKNHLKTNLVASVRNAAPLASQVRPQYFGRSGPILGTLATAGISAALSRQIANSIMRGGSQ